MTNETSETTVGQLPTPTETDGVVPTLLTRTVWLAWLAGVGVAAWTATGGGPWTVGPFRVDGLTVVMWVAATFFSGVVHSYSRRYVAGTRDVSRYFARLAGFTLAVTTLVAANHLAVFVVAWLAMGLVMARLIGHVRRWPQARAAERLCRRYFLASAALLAVGCGVAWWATGATTIVGVNDAATLGATAGAGGGLAVTVATVALVGAAVVQSALLPFHTWILSSMTAPTPASALMHAGFVNAGGILLARFASLVVAEPPVAWLVVGIGATSAIGGKFLKRVQPDAKRQLGCSTVGQMGFMTMQAGLGFFAAAITHLVLHGCYKAYQFLSVGERVRHTRPTNESHADPTLVGWLVTGVVALAGGVVFAVTTGKGTEFDAGLVLTALVVVTTLHATRGVVAASLPARIRYGVTLLVFLPSVAAYGVVYNVIRNAMAGLPVVTDPAAFGVGGWLVVGLFLVAYVVIDTDLLRRRDWLYVRLTNAARPAAETLLADRREYDE